MSIKQWAAFAGGVALSASAALLLQALPLLGWEPYPGDTAERAAQAVSDPAEAPRLTPRERVRLQRALNDVVAAGSSGAVAELVETGKGGRDTWNGVAGVASRDSLVPVDPGAHFRIASLSKPFLAAVVLQLAGEGRLHLDDTVEEHLPGILPDGERVTLRMLLSHTSGIYSYSHAMPDVVEDPDRVWEPAELVGIAAERDPVFAPGEDVGYSNTNYVLLAMVVEEVTGRPYDRELANRVLEPLGLTETSAPHDTAVPAPVLNAYVPVGGHGDAEPEPVTEFHPTRWYGTAQLVSTVSDVNHFYEALLAGQLHDDAVLREMLTVQAETEGGVGYALGPQRRVLSCGLEVWMHSGSIPGYRTWSVHSENRHFTMFQARFTADPDPPAWAAIEVAMCPAGAP